MQRREHRAPLGFVREPPLFDGDGFACGIADRAFSRLGGCADDELLGAFGAGDGGDDIGVGSSPACGVARCAFEGGGGEHGVALADLLGGKGDGLVGGVHPCAGAERRLLARARFGLGDDAAPHVLAESKLVGTLAP